MILVTGCARSGTSITANIIHACGANMGEINSNGENKYIRDYVTKPYLSSQGFDPLCQDVLPEPDKMSPFPELRELVVSELGSEPMAYKGAKMCHYWNIWADAFPGARWVIVRRDRESIIDSCVRTVFMHKRSSREAWGEWVDAHVERFEEMKENLNCFEIWPSYAIDGDYTEYKKMIEFCGLEWNEKAETVIRPGKWHGKKHTQTA